MKICNFALWKNCFSKQAVKAVKLWNILSHFLERISSRKVSVFLSKLLKLKIWIISIYFIDWFGSKLWNVEILSSYFITKSVRKKLKFFPASYETMKYFQLLKKPNQFAKIQFAKVFWSKLIKLWKFATLLCEKIVFLSKLLKLWNFEIFQVISWNESVREKFQFF